ncbi:MAG: glycosyltransferase family 4 protein [Burkholderiaceae bacterium]
MRIAVITRVFSKTGGGAESYAVAMVQELIERHDIHVFCQETNRPVTGATYHRVFCLSRKPRWLNQLLFALATWIKTRRGFDVVHSHENTWHGQIQTIHVKPIRLNLFVGHDSVGLVWQWIKVALSPRLLTYVWLEAARFKFKSNRKIVATSQSLGAQCAKTYPPSAAGLSVITPGTSVALHQPTRVAAHQQLGLSGLGQQRLVLFVANDYRRKGLDTLLQAMCLLPLNVSLLIAGNTEQMAKYAQQAKRLGLSQRVRFLGPLTNLCVAYCAADCLAHPTLEDSFAMVVLEAMAHGLPVVVSGPAYCGISQQLTDGRHALLLQDPQDPNQLSDRLRAVLEQPELDTQLSQQGLLFAQAHSWESAALQYEALYQQAAALTAV